jgi:hypothetical protein
MMKYRKIRRATNNWLIEGNYGLTLANCMVLLLLPDLLLLALTDTNEKESLAYDHYGKSCFASLMGEKKNYNKQKAIFLCWG